MALGSLAKRISASAPLSRMSWAVIVHIVHTGEWMGGVSEQLAVALQGKHVPIGVYALFVHPVHVDQMVAHLVRGIGEHQDDFFGAFAMPRRQMAKRFRLRMGNSTPTVPPPSLARTSAAMSSTVA